MKALPAHPWTIASYLRWVDRRKGFEDAREAYNVISREHVLKTGRVPTRHATVKNTMDLLERKAEVSDQHADLFEEEPIKGKPAPSPKADVDTVDDEDPEGGDPQESHAKSVQRRHMLSTKPKMVRRRPKG